MASFLLLGRYGGDWVRSVRAVIESVVPSREWQFLFSISSTEEMGSLRCGG